MTNKITYTLKVTIKYVYSLYYQKKLFLLMISIVFVRKPTTTTKPYNGKVTKTEFIGSSFNYEELLVPFR
jgi:hypothetical protein